MKATRPFRAWKTCSAAFIAFIAAVAVGCSSGSDGGSSQAGSGGGGAGSGGALAGAGGGAAGASGGSGGAAGARHGLEARPVNTTCKPPEDLTEPAKQLSQTGCVDPADPKRPAAGLVPYDVQSPLWSDDADKERYFAIPDGSRIRVRDCVGDATSCDSAMTGTSEDDADFTLPDGSVMVKTFKIAGRYVETRLLVKVDASNWFGYSYEWNDQQTDATVRPDEVNGHLKSISNGKGGQQTWHFPSRAQCLQCHTAAAGVSLGLSAGQLNRRFRYPNGVEENQLEALERVGLFASPLRRPLPAALPDPRDTTRSLTDRARSYLDANCAICHRPLSNFDRFDLRFATRFGDTATCNAAPEKGDLGVAGALRIVPGMPQKSLMVLRMQALKEGRMPQIGTSVMDDFGTKLVADWIAAMKGCD
jgi:uncharacterized repeat protein (TIGR03806 family)